MITLSEYIMAQKQLKTAQDIIDQYNKEKREAFKKRLKENPIFTDDELVYAATNRCSCGHGLAYPKECGPDHHWDCSAILKGIADKNVLHCGQYPFMLYSIKAEDEHYGTTRPKKEGENI